MQVTSRTGSHAQMRGRRGLQLLGHEDAADAWFAGDLAEPAPAVALIEARRLEADRIKHSRPAAALPAFFLEHAQHGGPKARAAHRLRKIEQVEEEEPERRAADRSADRVASRRVLDHDGERLEGTDARHGRVAVVQPPAARA